MTLDDAIIFAEDMARINEVEAKVHKAKGHIGSEYTCIGVAEHHRQVAEWLRALKEIWDSGDCNDCLHQNNCTIRPQLGQLVRFNCYQYERGIQNDNDNN